MALALWSSTEDHACMIEEIYQEAALEQIDIEKSSKFIGDYVLQ